ncbi:MAG: hypothetical protein JOZ47_19395 [Kutzneria sp.]|nr:hypothetical protein [Kutzneria sp.]
MPATSIAVRQLSMERFVALLPAGHELAGRRTVRSVDLSGRGVLTWPHRVNSGLCDRIIAAFDQVGAVLRIVRTAEGIATLATHVAAGEGIGLAVESDLAGRHLPGIVTVPFTGPSTTAQRVVITARNHGDPATQRLTELLLTTVRSH